MKNFKKSIALLVAVSMIVGCVIGGALAWLTHATDPVVNTFTNSDITATLTESENLDLKMVPGHTITKDPKVTVKAGSEACWLFVKIDKSNNFGSFMTFDVADGWTALDGVAGVYYREVLTSNMGTPYSVLKNDQVTVLSTVTKTDMNALTSTTYPKLTFTAYASQLYKNNTEKFTPAEAWKNI